MRLISKVFIFINAAFIMFSSAHLFGADGTGQDETLTPYVRDIPVVKIENEIFTEYQVFGPPSAARNRRHMTGSERREIIDDFALRRILMKEGNIPLITNSPEYRLNYQRLQERNSVEYLKDYIVEKYYIGEDLKQRFLAENKDNYSDLNDPEIRERFIEDIKSSEKAGVRNFVKSYLDSLKIVYGIEYNEDLLSRIADMKADNPDALANKVFRIGANKVLVSLADQKITVSSLASEIRRVKPYHLRHLSSVSVLKSMVEGPLLNSILSMQAKKKGLVDIEPVISQTDYQMSYFSARKYEDILLQESKFLPSREEMYTYFIENRDDVTLWSRRKMWVWEIFKHYDNDDENEDNHKIRVAIELENIRQKILNEGESFEKWARLYSRPRSRDGELGFIFESDYSMVGKTAAEMNEGDISGLIIQEKAISIIKVTQVQEPMVYKFDFVEPIIRRRLIERNMQEFYDNYRSEMFEKYNVEYIYNEGA